MPWWGQQSNVGNSVSPENQAREDSGSEQLAQQVNAPSLGSYGSYGATPSNHGAITCARARF